MEEGGGVKRGKEQDETDRETEIQLMVGAEKQRSIGRATV